MEELKKFIPIMFPTLFVFFFIFIVLLASSSSSGDPSIIAGTMFNVPFSEEINYRISSKFGYRYAPNNSGDIKFHNGVDLAVPYGTEVLSIGNGIVYEINTGCSDIGKYGDDCGNGFGNYVQIKHEKDNIIYYSFYAHMISDSIIVVPEQEISIGQKIGQVGSSGSSTGAHLHLTLMSPKPSFERKNLVDPKYVIEGL